MACASTCKTQSHATYGECLRSKGLAVTGLESTNPSFSRKAQKSWDSELDLYESAVKQGIQPETTNRKDVEAAIEASQILESPFRADNPPTIEAG
jgi:hypothetical protein